jgi:hypothetical protein
VIADPYTGECHVYTRPRDGQYRASLTFDFGDEIGLTDTPVGITLVTDEFPREDRCKSGAPAKEATAGQ